MEVDRMCQQCHFDLSLLISRVLVPHHTCAGLHSGILLKQAKKIVFKKKPGQSSSQGGLQMGWTLCTASTNFISGRAHTLGLFHTSMGARYLPSVPHYKTATPIGFEITLLWSVAFWEKHNPHKKKYFCNFFLVTCCTIWCADNTGDICLEANLSLLASPCFVLIHQIGSWRNLP